MPEDPFANDGIVAYEVTQKTCGAVVRTLEALTEAEDGKDTTFHLQHNLAARRRA